MSDWIAHSVGMPDVSHTNLAPAATSWSHLLFRCVYTSMVGSCDVLCGLESLSGFKHSAATQYGWEVSPQDSTNDTGVQLRMPLLFAFARKLQHLSPERFKLKVEIIRKPTLAVPVESSSPLSNVHKSLQCSIKVEPRRQLQVDCLCQPGQTNGRWRNVDSVDSLKTPNHFNPLYPSWTRLLFQLTWEGVQLWIQAVLHQDTVPTQWRQLRW